MNRTALTVATLVSSTTLAWAQTPPPADPATMPEPMPMPGTPPTGAAPAAGPVDQPPADPAADKAAKQPGRGDFDAGGQVRLPSGPDEMGQFATFNWIAADLKGKYYLLDTVTVNGTIPLAVKKPDIDGLEAKTIGGMTVTLDARLPKWDVPFAPKAKDTDVALVLTGAYMREGAMLLSEKDFPLFLGDFKPGLAGGLDLRVKMSSLVDFKLAPQFVYQSGSIEALQAVQLPTSLVLQLGSFLKVSADLGVYTGDDVSFKPSDGGRIYAGGALDVKLGPIIAHGGLGVASLLTGEDSMYPTIGDSVYVDLNVKYAK